jgi:hypothetical protein
MSRRAQQHALRMVDALPLEAREDLKKEPLPALQRLGYALRFREEHQIGGRCTVAGSFGAGAQPTITLVRTLSSGREIFTALHEYGHDLGSEDPVLHDAFDDEPDQGKKLEEDVCDAIAAELLIPPEVVEDHIGSRGPTAQAVLELREATKASREACCVRGSQRIFGSGYVMLAHDGKAQFTAAHNVIYPVRRGTEQPEGHLVRKAAEAGHDRARTPIRFPSGKMSPPYFADAVSDGKGYVFAVFVETNPPWIKGPAIVPREDIFPGQEAYCPHCEVDFEAHGAPCSNCGGYFHRPRGCGKCACQVIGTPEDRLCNSCFLLRPRSDFTKSAKTCDICLGD